MPSFVQVFCLAGDVCRQVPRSDDGGATDASQLCPAESVVLFCVVFSVFFSFWNGHNRTWVRAVDLPLFVAAGACNLFGYGKVPIRHREVFFFVKFRFLLLGGKGKGNRSVTCVAHAACKI